ncbi:MAG: DUF3352 domain-containing protein [Solirubrobacteraceae bacterium]
MKIARSLLLLLLAVAVAAVGAGCGSSSSGSGGGSDPAGAVPAGAPVYVEANVHPTGTLGADVQAVLKKVLRTNDPAAKLTGLIDQSGRKDGVTYAKDIAPWLGDRVGIGVISLTGAKPDYVAIAASKDDAKARASLAKGSKGVKRTYKGVDYTYDPKDGTATAAFGGRAFAGTENGLRAAIDTTKGGPALADANSLRAAREKVAAERVGFLYVDVQGALQAAQRSAGGADPQVGAVLQAFGGALPKTIAAALEADPDLIRIDAVSLGTPKATSGKSGADAVAKLPGDSILALGVADLGGTLDRTLKALGGSGLGGVGVEAVLRQFKAQTGLDVRQDLLSWMGDAGIYVSGASPQRLHGALVVQSTDPALTRKAIGALARLARTQAKTARISALKAPGVDAGFSVRSPGSPRVDVALAGDRFVVGIGGAAALKDAISPASQLGSSPAFTSAAGRLGNGLRPSFFLDMTRVTALAAAKAGGDPRFAKVKPYLDAFGALVAGAKDEGEGVTRARFAITLR